MVLFVSPIHQSMMLGIIQFRKQVINISHNFFSIIIESNSGIEDFKVRLLFEFMIYSSVIGTNLIIRSVKTLSSSNLNSSSEFDSDSTIV